MELPIDYVQLTTKEKNQLLIDNALYQLHTSQPAIVTEVDLDNQTISAQISNKITLNIDGIEKNIEYPILRKIPFFSPQNQDFQITIPPKIGDSCILIFLERNSDEFWETGKVSTPTYAKIRRHSINDAVAICGFNPKPKKISDYQEQSIEIRSHDRKTRIALYKNNVQIASLNAANEDGIDLKINNSANLKLKNRQITASIQPAEGGGAGTTLTMTDSKISASIAASSGGAGTSLTMIDNSVHLLVGSNGVELLITDTGVLLTGNKTLTMNVSDVNVNSSSTVTWNVSNSFNIKAQSVNIDADVNIQGLTVITGDTTITGAAKISGDLDVKLINHRPQNAVSRWKDSPATIGTLTTGNLDPWDVFLSKLHLEQKAIHFKITGGTEEYEINITDTQKLKNYDDLAVEINRVASNLLCLYEENYLLIKTYESGKIGGNITYLQDIIISGGDTSGTLLTGTLDPWSSFVSSFQNLGIAFKINIANNFNTITLTYEELTALKSFAELADNFNTQLQSNATVTVHNDTYLLFTTSKSGQFKGKISYLTMTDTNSSPASLISGEFDPDYSNFKTTLGDQNFAVQVTINENHEIFYQMNSELTSYTSFDDFFSNLFQKNLVIDFEYKQVTLKTKNSGSTASITYFSTITEVPATKAYLLTAILPDFLKIKNLYSAQSLDITFSWSSEGTDYNFSITPDNLLASSSWSDIVAILNAQLPHPQITLQNNAMLFSNIDPGASNISYLTYTNDPTNPSIDGSLLLGGGEGTATKYNGTDVIQNIYNQSASIISLTQDKGAIIQPGSDDIYNNNSIYLMKGTANSGAILRQGQDGTVTIINDSATLLKGTRDTSAVLVPGHDAGEDPAGTFDGIMTIDADVNIVNQLTTRALIVQESANITGEINLNPREIEDGQPTSITSVVVSGDIDARNINISGDATVDHLIVNDGIDDTGDINIDNGRIISNGIQLSFNFMSLESNKMISAPDFEWD